MHRTFHNLNPIISLSLYGTHELLKPNGQIHIFYLSHQSSLCFGKSIPAGIRSELSVVAMLTSGGGGRVYWGGKDEVSEKSKGIVVIFAWVSVQETHLKNFVDLYSSLGWNSLVCLADFLNPLFPERATSLAFFVLTELLEEIRRRPCPLVLAAFSGGSKACMYTFFQIITGACEVQLNQDDSRLVTSCISGQIYDSSPVDFSGDWGVRFASNHTILKIPGSAKLASFVAKVVTTGLDSLFLTKFTSQHSEYWQTLYSSVGLGAPFLILCSEDDDLAPYQTISCFAQKLQSLGGNVKIVKWNASPHLGHFNHNPIQYEAAVTGILEQAVSVFTQKMKIFGEMSGKEGMHDEIFELVCDLQNAAVVSNQSLRRVALGPNDHFFLPSSAEQQNGREHGPLQEESKGSSINISNPPSINAHSVLGQILFDACVPRNVEGWDIKFTGSINGKPFASASKHSPLSAIKCISRSKL